MCRPGRFIMYTDKLNALAKGGIYPTRISHFSFPDFRSFFFFSIKEREQVEQVILFRRNEDARKWRRRRFLNHHFSTRPGKCIYCLPTVILLLISWIFFVFFSRPPVQACSHTLSFKSYIIPGPPSSLISSSAKEEEEKKEIYPHKSSIAFSVWRGGPTEKRKRKKEKYI